MHERRLGLRRLALAIMRTSSRLHRAMKIQKSLIVEKEPRLVFEILGPKYGEADTWASSVFESTARHEGQPLNGAPCTGRICQTSLGSVTEQLVDYDEDERVVAYSAKAKKMPFFVKEMVNRWQVRSAGPDRSRVDMTLHMRLSFPFSILMAVPMRIQLSSLLGQAVEELKHYAEHGTPHPRKKASRHLATEAGPDGI